MIHNQWKKLLIPMSLVLTMGLVSCNNASKTEDTKDVAEEHNDAKFNKEQEKDAQFLVEAADLNLMEIKLSELARESAVMDDCKKLAGMMIDDHSKALADVSELAAKKGVTLPTDMSDAAQREFNNLNEKKGTEFDKKYCDMMVNDHKDAIDKFEKAASNASDSDIRAFASGILPKLRAHLDHAMTCQEKCHKM